MWLWHGPRWLEHMGGKRGRCGGPGKWIKNVADQIAFQVAGGLTALENILQVVAPATNMNTVSRIPPNSQ